MSKTILDAQDVASGGTATATLAKRRSADVAFRLSASAGGGSVDVDLTGVKLNNVDEGTFASPNTTEGVAAVDVSGGDVAFRFYETDGYEEIEVTITNQAASGATLSLVADPFEQGQ